VFQIILYQRHSIIQKALTVYKLLPFSTKSYTKPDFVQKLRPIDV